MMSIRPVVLLGMLALIAACGSEERSGPHVIIGVTSVSAGGVGTCALGGTGAMVCWGEVPSGTETDTLVQEVIPVTLGARTVAISEPFTSLGLSKSPHAPTGCAVGETDQVYCWGHLDIHFDWTLPLGTGISALAGATGASSVSVGLGHLCVTGGDRQVRCFGDFNGGGRGTDSVDLGAVDPDATLIPNGLSPSLSAFGSSQGWRFGCALRTDSLVACWGTRERGQVGRVTSDTVQACGAFSNPWCQPGPALVDGGNKYRQLSVGDQAACATRISGEVECWGLRPGAPNCDVAGDCVKSPTQVPLPGLAARVVVGNSHACALLVNAAAYCWGDNSVGQLGRTGASSATPVPVSGGFSFVTLSAGADHTCGIEFGSGAVGCWGSNNRGELGDGTLIDRDRPVAVVAAE